jgi:hypothetical protein
MDHHTEPGSSTSGGSEQADAVASTDDPGFAPESGEHGGQGSEPGATQSEQAGAAPESGDR